MKAQTSRYRFDDLLIDTGTRRVIRGGADLGITGLTFDLLVSMGQVAPNLLSADALIDSVWPGQVVSSETVTQRIKLLRQLLGDDAANPRYLASRRGHGYRLMSPMVPLPLGQSRPSRDDQAYELYMQARAIVRGTSESKDEALKFLERALSRDPEFAQALAYRALLQAGSVALTGAPRDLLVSAEQDAVRALWLDPDLSDAYVARALVYADRRQWIEVETHFQAARAMDPANPFVNNLYALSMLRPAGRLNQACAQLTDTYRAVPADGFTIHELILTHSLLGNDVEVSKFAGLREAVSGIAEPPWDVVLALARADARHGRFSEAAAHAAQALPSILRANGGAGVVESFYSALAIPSQAARACEALESFVPRLAGVGVDCRTRAFFVSAFAMLGELGAAYDLIDRFLFTRSDAHFSVDLSDLWLPEMRSFRADPRFEPLVERLGLTEYWRRYGAPDHDA
ncbi:MAG: winged helix-turn-helix domain-containing protein [Gammaproteobacteria bacterium]